MRSIVVVVLALCALLSLHTVASSDLASLEHDVSLLETASASVPSAESILADAQKQAEETLKKALDAGNQLLADAAKQGRDEAVALAQLDEPVKTPATTNAKPTTPAAKPTTPAQSTATKKTKKAKKAFRSLGLSADSQGVFGGVNFGVSKANSSPVAPVDDHKGRTHMNKFDKYGRKKDIYGNKKACLKDIAAHFDEADIYEAKKNSLLQKMDQAKDRSTARSLRRRLANLETWHQMMQKKFLRSENERIEHEKKMERLFAEHLPAELQRQLAANKVAQRASQKLPYPDAKKQALKFLRSIRKKIQKDERLKALGHKKYILPTTTNPDFPSMDPISSSLREKLWRQVHTENEWSTDSGDLQRAEGVVKKAHKAHGDFVEGPIAEPLLKGKLYHPDTEPLGVPNFLTKFPWPLTPEQEVTMDDKVKVEQTDYTTW